MTWRNWTDWRCEVKPLGAPAPERFKTFDGIELAYRAVGEGDPVILLHGFAVDSVANWFGPGVVRALVEAGLKVLALDARGHGSSDKPHDRQAYSNGAMVADVSSFIDHLGLSGCYVAGYSMGGGTALAVAVTEPRAIRVVAAGVGVASRGRARAASGAASGRRPRDRGVIAQAMSAGEADSITTPRGRAFRRFAESTGADLEALAAVAQAAVDERSPALGGITTPLMVVAGEDDTLAGDPYRLALAIPRARAATVPGDHLSAVNQAEFRKILVDFLVGHT
ncbi:MAG: alpha/beta fold hydrolase [Acidimicrobiales bacterium]